MIRMKISKKRIICLILGLVCTYVITFAGVMFSSKAVVYASERSALIEGAPGDSINIGINTESSSSMTDVIRMIIVLTILSLAPSILIMLTSFTRIIIVLHFLRTAIGTNTAPPNQVLIGLALFLTFFIMAPVFNKINDEAIKPLTAEEITVDQAIEKACGPLKEFMLKQTRQKDLRTFVDIAQIDTTQYDDAMEIPMRVVIPAFIISELRIAFIIGFLIYIPFIVIDMVVSSTLMSMGMMMLPPTTISLPFKILLFVLADGWNLIIGNLVNTFL